jgi:hypothetical protein
MNEEQYLINKAGKENPFRVPEGYFDSLASQVMSRVDAEGNKPQDMPMIEKKAKTVWLRPVLYAAASVCALFISVTAYQHFTAQPVENTTEQVAVYSEDSFDEAADYVMIDNQDIYACLTGEY